MALTKIEGVLQEKIRIIKNNTPDLIKLDWNPEPIINLLDPKQFYKHYSKLALIKEEQEQCLEQLNIRLCQHCLIPCDFQYCNKCNLIYNPPSCMIYTILKEEKPISSCTSELESTFNSDSNSDNNNNKNNGSNSAQYGNEINNNSDSNSNPKTYIMLPNLTKKQKLKWFSNNDKNIMPECAHDTNTEFDLRYLEKDAITLKLHSHTYINLKIVLKILTTTIVQLASRSSLAKKEINIRGGIIDAEYVRNIIAMLQNNSEKAYIIEPNEKIAQVIFLPLVKIAQLVSVKNREELGITARSIWKFEFTNKIDVPINMAEEEVIDKEKIISICQVIFILLYDQYMLAIKKKYYILNNIWTRRMLSVPTKTIGTDEHRKLRLTTTYAA
ncbi:hypothetical protein G9A89_018153 [Geosiphon pyriformis]|nr:hypothetical protein G9A89_018153 [Geosiphon pyriformis]